jgi:uncharacterized membrane protein YagU involved in acid resistance
MMYNFKHKNIILCYIILFYTILYYIILYYIINICFVHLIFNIYFALGYCSCNSLFEPIHSLQNFIYGCLSINICLNVFFTFSDCVRIHSLSL